MDALSCMTCRMIRRFVLAFGLGGFVAWQAGVTLPFDGGDVLVGQGLLLLVILFSILNLVIRMRQLRARWRR